MGVISIKDFEINDEEIFISMAHLFYETGMICNKINPGFLQKTYFNCISNSPYVRGVFICYDDEISGYALLTFTYSNEYGGKIMEIDEIYIKDEFREKGIANDFVSTIIAEYRHDVTYVEVVVMKDNIAALKLCEKHGFIANDYIAMHKTLYVNA